MVTCLGGSASVERREKRGQYDLSVWLLCKISKMLYGVSKCVFVCVCVYIYREFDK